MGRKLTRRSFLLVAGGAMGTALLAACGGEEAATTPGGTASGGSTAPTGGATVPATTRTTTSAGSSGTATRIVFWSSWGGSNGQAVQKLVDDFNSSQSDIIVENQFQGTYEETAQKLATALTANQAPDLVVLSEVTWNRFYLNQTLQDLDGYFQQASFDPSDYVDPLINEGTRNGKIWWVPFARSTPLFYYNRDLFRAAGLPDRGPSTWDELAEWGPDLMQAGGENTKAFAFTTAKNYSAWYFHGNVWQWNGHYSDGLDILIAEPNPIAAGEWVRRFIHEQGMGYMAEDQSVDFVNQLCATTMQSTGSLGGITEAATFEVGTAFLPEQEQFGCPTGGSGLAIPNTVPEERKQAAVEFIKFLARPENVVFWSTTSGYMPVTKSARESAEMQQYFQKNPNFKVAVDQLPKTQAQEAARLIVPNGDQTIGTGLERIFVRNEPAETVFQDVARQLEQDAGDIRDQVEAVGL